MSPPSPLIDPSQRQTDQITEAGTYRPSDPVWGWVPSGGQWRPGVVDASSDAAVLVTFLLGPGGGTAVDSLLPQHVMARTERDTILDGAIADQSLPRRAKPDATESDTLTKRPLYCMPAQRADGLDPTYPSHSRKGFDARRCAVVCGYGERCIRLYLFTQYID